MELLAMEQLGLCAPTIEPSRPRACALSIFTHGFTGKGNIYPLQYSCLENFMDRAWEPTVHGVTEGQTRLSDFTFMKLQYFGHLIRRADSFEKTLMLGKIEGRRRRG